ncbi:MAG: CHAT domain-containing protein [Cyanobacteria bacterium P01_F01_bin.53]
MRSLRRKLARSIVKTCVQSCLKGSVVLLAMLGVSSEAIIQGRVVGKGAANAQHIIPDSTHITNTTVIEDASGHYTLTGGTESSGTPGTSDTNLFHNFSEFTLLENQSANFTTSSDIQNVFANVLSSAASASSFIDGTLLVSGSDANLYLINPAGILFGPDAQLMLPGSFTATTSTGLHFGNQSLNLLNVTGDYGNFNGNVTAFDLGATGAIANLGNLEVAAGQNLSLMGGTIVNTGRLAAPGGNINLTAIENGDRIRINQNNQLLSIEVANSPGSITPATIAEMLTGSALDPTNLEIQIVGDEVQLVNMAPIPENSGSLIASGTLSADNSSGTGGNLSLFGSQIALTNSELGASGQNGGGNIQIGHDYGNTNTTLRTYISHDSQLTADALSNGKGGQIAVFSSPSIRVDDLSTHIYGALRAQGENGGSIDITGKNLIYEGSTTVTGRSGTTGAVSIKTNNITITDGAPLSPTPQNLTNLFDGLPNNPSILYENHLEQFANVELSARHDIVIDELVTDGALTFQPGGNVTFLTDSNDRFGGQFIMRGQDAIQSIGGNLTIRTGLTGEDIATGRLDTGLASGSIELISDSITLAGGDSSITTHTLTLEPDEATTNVQVGGDASSQTNTLLLSTSELRAVNDDVTQLNIGRTNGVGAISLSSYIAVTPDNQNSAQDGPQKTFRGNGNDATLRLIGPDALDTVWTVTGENTGTLSNYGQAQFSGIGNIVSSDGDDRFQYETPDAHITGSILAGEGALILVGDDIDLPNSINGQGKLSIQPNAPTDSEDDIAAIEIGGIASGEPNTLSISSDELSHIGAGFTAIEIGSELENGDGGEITQLSDLSFDQSVTLRSPSTINTNNFSLTGTGDASLTLEASGDITTGALTTADGDISVTTPAFFRATNTRDNTNTSVETSANSQITIQHGGNGATPFSVGNADVNGTVGTIVTGQGTPQETVLENTEILETQVENNITISTEIVPPPEVTPPEVTPPEVTPPEVTPPEVEPPEMTPSESSETPNDPTESPLTLEAELVSRAASVAPILEEQDAQDLSIKLNGSDSAEIFERIETNISAQFLDHLSLDDKSAPVEIATLPQVKATLREISERDDTRAALVYVYFVPHAASPDSVYPNANRSPQPDDQLEIMLVTPDGAPRRKRQWGVTRAKVEKVANEFRYQTTRAFSQPHEYLAPAQQLYEWLVEPLENNLSTSGTNNLAMIMDDGLRTLPLSALHDGNQFLVEKYSMGLMPTFSLTNFEEDDEVQSNQVLAMGASQFANQPPLPAVEAELSYITEDLWLGKSFINESFTLANLKSQISSQEYGIVHLATHAAFEAGDLDNSYIQLWDQRMGLSQLQNLDLAASNIGLIILSACSTAMGDRRAEYGFAGFALNAGSEAALASLWPVSDEGTLGFMTQFYGQLAENTTRAEALRQAQLALLSGQVGISNGQVYGPSENGEKVLSVIPELAESGTWDFSHPYYWSTFTMIGSPW